MRTVVIGATGHIGTYLVPRLVAQGHEVVAVSRGERQPYRHSGAWQFVETVHLDREPAERDGRFGSAIAELEPDAVVDLICFTPESCRQLVEALEGRVQHLLHCGTIWVHGPAELVPTLESAARRPYGAYGVQKAEIEAYLLRRARVDGFPATVLHPGHIVGPGWVPINPAGNLDLRVFEDLANGRRVRLPERGLATLHHVHADDVAAAFELALAHWSASVGESFHVVSPRRSRCRATRRRSRAGSGARPSWSSCRGTPGGRAWRSGTPPPPRTTPAARPTPPSPRPHASWATPRAAVSRRSVRRCGGWWTRGASRSRPESAGARWRGAPAPHGDAPAPAVRCGGGAGALRRGGACHDHRPGTGRYSVRRRAPQPRFSQTAISPAPRCDQA